MGWSLKGIIGGALVGGAGAAEKHFVAEDNMARELAAKKEMADYTAEIDFNKTKRLEEWKAGNKDTAEMRERESISENTALASDAAIAAGEKPGTVGYHASMADFFARSGRPELADKALAEANRIRTDDTKDQIAAARLDAANARAARGGGGGGGGKGADGGSLDINKEITDIGTHYAVGYGEEKNKTEKDPAGVAEAHRLFEFAKKQGATDEAAIAYARSTVSEASQLALAKKLSFSESIDKLMTARKQGEIDTRIRKAGESDAIMPDEQTQSVATTNKQNANMPKPAATNAGIIPRTLDPGSELPYIPADEFKLPITPGKNPRQSK